MARAFKAEATSYDAGRDDFVRFGEKARHGE